MNFRSLVWAPTISLSWLWGLGFFYSIHVTLTYGWLGFIGFAMPNALGLGLFGWIIGRAKSSPDMIVKSFEDAYGGVILLFQFASAAITIFGFVAYFWAPMYGAGAAIGVALFLFGASAIGHGLSLTGIKWLHVATLAVALVAGVLALFALTGSKDAWTVPLASFDNRFYGLVIPTLVGFLLGPWLDIQQWQRAAAIQREGGSVGLAYAVGAILFLGLLSLNALLAAAAGKGGIVISADGLPGAEGAVAFASAHLSAGLLGIGGAYAVWTTLALGTTIDSSYNATRWFLATKQSRSVSAILALIPPGVASSPLWLIGGATFVAAMAYRANLALIYLMLPFATLFVSSAACLVCEVLGGRRVYDPVLCFLIGCAAAIIFVLGYLPPTPLFLTLSPLVGLIGAAPAIIGFFAPQTGGDGKAVVEIADAPPARIVTTAVDVVASQGFDGQWFVMHLMPTYDDTNSVGNIYFANYVRWVGKARELFFNICMPAFDLKTTQYYVLTRSFTHDFRMEAKEFEAISLRIRISGHNRKFVTLQHEIYGGAHEMLGRGEQTLMFVDTKSGRPLDIPGEIIRGFLPYWPKDSRISQSLQAEASEELLIR